WVTSATGSSAPYTDTCYCNESRTYEVNAEGPAFDLDAGEARIAVGMGRRTNALANINRLAGSGFDVEEGSRFAFAEMSIPLIGSGAGNDGPYRMAVTAAVRSEDY